MRALGSKVVGGVSCTGYAVTLPDAQGTINISIDQQHLVREITMAMTVGLPVSTASPSAAPTGTTTAPSIDLTMDFSYSAAPVHVTAPPASSTISVQAFLQQREQGGVS